MIFTFVLLLKKIFFLIVFSAFLHFLYELRRSNQKYKNSFFFLLLLLFLGFLFFIKWQKADALCKELRSRCEFSYLLCFYFFEPFLYRILWFKLKLFLLIFFFCLCRKVEKILKIIENYFKNFQKKFFFSSINLSSVLQLSQFTHNNTKNENSTQIKISHFQLDDISNFLTSIIFPNNNSLFMFDESTRDKSKKTHHNMMTFIYFSLVSFIVKKSFKIDDQEKFTFPEIFTLLNFFFFFSCFLICFCLKKRKNMKRNA